MKLSPLTKAKIQILFATGCISQAQLATIFKVSQERVSMLVRKRK